MLAVALCDGVVLLERHGVDRVGRAGRADRVDRVGRVGRAGRTDRAGRADRDVDRTIVDGNRVVGTNCVACS